MRVLIAEDDPALATFVRKGLEAEHYAVDIRRRLRVSYQLLKRFHMVPVHFARATRVLHVAFSGDLEYPALLAIE